MKITGIPEGEMREMEEHCNRQIAELETLPDARAVEIAEAVKDFLENIQGMRPEDAKMALRFISETGAIYSRLMSQHSN